MGDDRPEETGTTRPADKGGSYTARPSHETPEDGPTRDEEQEEVERTGSGTDRRES